MVAARIRTVVEYVWNIGIFKNFILFCRTIYIALYHKCCQTSFLLLLFNIILSTFPLYVNWTSVDRDAFGESFPELLSAITSTEYETWLLVSVFVAVPMSLQVLLNFQQVFKSQEDRIKWIGSLLLSTSLIAPSLCMYLLCKRLPSPSTLVLAQTSIIVIQQIAIIAGMFVHMFGHQKNYRIIDRCAPFLLNVEQRLVSVMLFFFLSNCFYVLSNHNYVSLILSAFFAFDGVFFLLIFAVRMLIKLSWQLRKFHCFVTHEHLSDFMYSLAIFVFVVADLIVVSMAINHGVRAKTLLLAVLYIQIALTCFLSLVPNETSKRLAAFRHEKLETRLNLIRYVSHEMRTPLNTATMGLSFIKDELTVWRRAMRGKNLSLDASEVTSWRSNSLYSLPGSVTGEDRALSGVSLPTGHLPLRQSLTPLKMEEFSSPTITQAPKTFSLCALNEMIETVSEVNDSCQVAISTLDDLLTFDKLDERKLVIELLEINPWTFLISATKPFAINARHGQVQFRVRKADASLAWDQWVVRGDQFKLSQVMRNLLSNALKFVAPMGTIDVSLSHFESNGKTFARIAVRDDGAGISVHNQRKLFGQYVQFNAAQLQQGKGSGLGLWISKSIVEMHKGHISVYSEGEGKGTSFFVDLPLSKKKASHSASQHIFGDRDLSPALSAGQRLLSSLRASSPSNSIEQQLHSISMRDSSSQMSSRESNRLRSPVSPASVRSRNSSSTSQSLRAALVERAAVNEPLRKISEAIEARSGSELLFNAAAVHSAQALPAVAVDAATPGKHADAEHSSLAADHTPLFQQRCEDDIETGAASADNAAAAAALQFDSKRSSHRRTLLNRFWLAFSAMGDRYQRDELDAQTIREDPDLSALQDSTTGSSARQSSISSIKRSGSAGGSMFFLNQPIRFWMPHHSFRSGSTCLENENESLDGLRADLENAPHVVEDACAHALSTINEAREDVPPLSAQPSENAVQIFDDLSAHGLVQETSGGSNESTELVAAQCGSRPRTPASLSRFFQNGANSRSQVLPTFSADSRENWDAVRELPLRDRAALGCAQHDSLLSLMESSFSIHSTQAVEDDRERSPLDVASLSSMSRREGDEVERFLRPVTETSDCDDFDESLLAAALTKVDTLDSHDDDDDLAAVPVRLGRGRGRRRSIPSTSLSPSRRAADESQNVDISLAESKGRQDAKMEKCVSDTSLCRADNKQPAETDALQRLRILVVDDSTPNRKMLSRLLTVKGHVVKEAFDGVHCLSTVDAADEPFDVVLMDDNMPNMTGTEAAKRLREKGFAGLLYGVTGDLFPETVERFVAQGADRVMGKPLNIEELHRRISEDLKRRNCM